MSDLEIYVNSGSFSYCYESPYVPLIGDILKIRKFKYKVIDRMQTMTDHEEIYWHLEVERLLIDHK